MSEVYNFSFSHNIIIQHLFITFSTIRKIISTLCICLLSLSLLPAAIFAQDNLLHLLRRLLAAASQPHFHYGIKAAPEKFNMILDMLIVKMALSLVHIIVFQLELIVVAQLKICTVKQLIFLDMSKQPQIVIAVVVLFSVRLIKSV